MKKYQTKAFTLVELIIVITILAILATIGFMSYQSYTIDARDGKRKSDLGEIRNGLELYQAKNSLLPDPDSQNVNIMSGSLLISIQGYIGSNLLQKLRASNDIKDSLDNNYYTYSLDGTKTKYQLLSMLENQNNLVSLNQGFRKSRPVEQTYARTDYTNRYPYTLGNKVGVFFSGTTNIPINTATGGTLNLSISNTQYKVMFSNDITNSGIVIATGNILPKIIDEQVNPNSIKNIIRKTYPIIANYVDSLSSTGNILISNGSLGGVPYLKFIGTDYNNNELLNEIVKLIIQERITIFTNNFNFYSNNLLPYPIIQSFKYIDKYPSINWTDYGYNNCDGSAWAAVDKNLTSYNDHIFVFFPCDQNYIYNYSNNIKNFLFNLK